MQKHGLLNKTTKDVTIQIAPKICQFKAENLSLHV